MKARDIIVVGTSAGGLSALKNLVRELPPDLPATVFIVQHLSPSHSSVLPALLERAGKLKVSYPLDGERFIKSHVYVAPPDHHLIIEDGHIRLSQGPKENLTRPAIDPLFRSAALAFRSRVIVEESTLARHLTEHRSRAIDPETLGEWESNNRRAGLRAQLIQQVLNHKP